MIEILLRCIIKLNTMDKLERQSIFNHSNKDIFERDKAGETIRLNDPEYPKLYEVILKSTRKTAELNDLITDDFEKIRNVFSELIGKKVDDTFVLIPPVY